MDNQKPFYWGNLLYLKFFTFSWNYYLISDKIFSLNYSFHFTHCHYNHRYTFSFPYLDNFFLMLLEVLTLNFLLHDLQLLNYACQHPLCNCIVGHIVLKGKSNFQWDNLCKIFKDKVPKTRKCLSSRYWHFTTKIII